MPIDYLSGDYYAGLADPDQDSQFKATAFLHLFNRVAMQHGIRIDSYIDVGCGSGGALRRIADGLRPAGHPLEIVKGYDIAPHVGSLRANGIEFVHGDFNLSDEKVDLVTLFDVLEHVPAPIDFLRDVASRCRFLGLHIPLEHTLANEMLDRFRHKLVFAGHLIYLDPVSALNLLALSGLVTLDYEYTYGFLAPSGRERASQRLVFPFRRMFAYFGPWLLTRTIGGVSLMVVAATPNAQFVDF